MIGAPKPELVGYGVENRSCKLKKIIIVEADREEKLGLKLVCKPLHSCRQAG